MLTFYVVRHGQTESNVRKKIMGHLDSPLTDEGIRNALSTARRLKGKKFYRVYTSDLGRAFITAHLITDKLKLANKLHRAKELREMDYGIWENKNWSVAFKRKRDRFGVRYVVPGGESYVQMQKRAVNFVKRLEKKHPNKTLLLVTHRGPARGIICYFKNLDLQKFRSSVDLTHQYLGKFVINKGKLVSYKRLSN